MPTLNDLLFTFLDCLIGHLALTACLLAVTDERAVWRRLKKMPLLLLSPLAAMLLSALLYAVPQLGILQYFIYSFSILIMCTVWVRWTWQFGFWQAFAVTCMAGIFQVTATALTNILFWVIPLDEKSLFGAAVVLHLSISIATSLLLYKLRFGIWLGMLLDNEPATWRIALFLFALEATMELFFCLVNGVQSRYLLFYYLLVVVMVVLMATLVTYLAQRFDAARKMQAQQGVIAQQQLYERDLEIIRR